MMLLSEAERDRLLVFATAELARARRRRGLRLNIVEATALVADAVCEAARDGGRLADAIEAGRSVLTERDIMPGVIRAVPEVRVEAVFDDGTRLAVVRDPFRVGPAAAPQAAERFEPGATRPAVLVPIGGRRVVIGFAGLVDGPLDAPGARERALEKARACGYADSAAGS
jgi:urease subunit gamma/beta